MKVLQINLSDTSGGAAIAGYRLHNILRNLGIDSKLLVHLKITQDINVIQMDQHLYLKRVFDRISRGIGLQYLNILNTWQIKQLSCYQDVNIINFHNLHGGYFNYLALPQLTMNIPSVYTLHDMWSFTGHCAYSFECDRWQLGCGKCPNLSTYPSIKTDNTQLEWKLKKWVYQKSNLTIVTPSQWLKKQVEKSILKDKDSYCIPNGIPTDIFRPLDAQLCRTALNLPQDKYIIACAAQNLNDFRKGSDLLLEALTKIPPSLKKELKLLTFGHLSKVFIKQIDIEIISLGYVESDRLKTIFYSASDLFICPTRADNLPLVLQESMACGTPMVSFDVGGVPELVRPNLTGYLAKVNDPQDLCDGIIKLLKDKPLREQMSQNCRDIAITEYSMALQCERYIQLYNEIIS